ncbi:GNAT family N-acetyltransferase [Saccharopolyspora sp. HNM0983]|uniref:GNAT family N-acetyltransferase n=1 Tax=Saccharopolyspora montiporae TaxID=2781240 RepID=A0A929B624_9PSEU|nr:GNAT family N-acetyltransferase [Saccharopolyspora sp. HNM0983]MBE9372930.1 GNAT family N-acetyltransferase [Saccharopolyspora sp. HNM0983]
MGEHPGIRRADDADAEAAGRLLDAFNREFDEPTPGPGFLAERLRALLAEDTIVLLAGTGPDGIAVLRFRPALWSSGQECYLAELYVRPPERHRGLGRELLRAALDAARSQGAVRIELGTAETDVAARRLYEHFGFTHREGGSDGPVLYVYEREL